MLFKTQDASPAFLKMGLMGFPGSGKTYTAASIAIGLTQHMRKLKLDTGSKPVLFLDTETGSDWVRPMFQTAKIELMIAKTRSFADLITAVKEAEKSGSVLLIDSITHFWTEFVESYCEGKRRKRGPEFSDWAWLKKEWRNKFTDSFINSNLHIVMCGRAGFEYEHYTDETGKKQIAKSGVKMKAEGELGFEPSILVLMERDEDVETHELRHVAHVMKDRRTDEKSLDGKSIINPTFKDFLPHIEALNLGGSTQGIDVSRTSEHMIERETDSSMQRKIVVDEIQAVMVERYPGQDAESKKAKAALILKYFRTRSWTEVSERLSLSELRRGYDLMHQDLLGQRSQYGGEFAPVAPAPEAIDEIPHMAAKEAGPAPQPPSDKGAPVSVATISETKIEAPDDMEAMARDMYAALQAAKTLQEISEITQAHEDCDWTDRQAEKLMAATQRAMARAQKAQNGKAMAA